MSTYSFSSWYSSGYSEHGDLASLWIDGTSASTCSSSETTGEGEPFTNSDASSVDRSSRSSYSDALQTAPHTEDNGSEYLQRDCDPCWAAQEQHLSDVYSYKKAVFRATSGSPLHSDLELAWIKDQVRRVLVNGQFGPNAAVWTRHALEYRMLEGGLQLAAAIALLPNDSPLPRSLAFFLYTEIICRRTSELIWPRQSLPVPNPFANLSFAVDPPSSLEHRMLWATWAQVYARWLLGEGDVWDSWAWDNWAPRPVTLNVEVRAEPIPKSGSLSARLAPTAGPHPGLTVPVRYTIPFVAIAVPGICAIKRT